MQEFGDLFGKLCCIVLVAKLEQPIKLFRRQAVDIEVFTVIAPAKEKQKGGGIVARENALGFPKKGRVSISFPASLSNLEDAPTSLLASSSVEFDNLHISAKTFEAETMRAR